MIRGMKVLAGILLAVSAAGCSSNKQLLRQQQTEIASLSGRLGELEQQLAEERARAEELRVELDEALAEFRDKERLYLERIEAQTILTLPDAVLFSSGSARLTAPGRTILDRVADVLREHPDREIRIEGHTDDVPIAHQFRDRYPSNWELSSARAHAVLHYFQRTHALPGKRLSAIGCGEYRPAADNDTPEGRAMNRRVVIRMGPMPVAPREAIP